MPDIKHEVLLSDVGTFVGLLFVGSFALGAGLIIWHAAFGNNPLEAVLLSTIYQN